MDKRVVSVLVALLATVLWSQTVPEKWTVYTFVGTYSTPYPSGVETKIETEFGDLLTSGYIGNRYGMPFIRTAETDTLNESLIFPMIFDVPDKDEEGNFTGENIGIQEYLEKHGETDEYGFQSIPYLNFLEEAVPSFWRTMFKRTNDGTSVPNVSSEIEIRYIWVPETTNDPWIINDEGSYGTRMNNLQNLIRNTLEPGEYDSYKNRSERKSVMLMLPEYPGTSGFGYVSYLGDLVVRVFWRPEVLNQTTNSIVHELGHSILYYDDQGSGKVAYDGKLTDILKLGRTYNTTGIYDLMHRTGSTFSPHLLYGLLPFNTEDLMNTNGVLLKNKIIPENSNENKTITCLKAIREDLTDEELLDDNTFETISIPITPDPVFDGETNGNLVTNQKFLIEYRNGESFDNYTAMYQDHISKGVLISHIIKSPYSSEYLSKRIIDIECAVPFPDGYRDPSESWPSNPTYNGEWYFGKKINDWMDDYAPLYRWPIEGGKSTWWRLQPPIKFQSLPTDFFNDSDRNKFTPVTRPNTNSWKGAETNIGVFVDKIEGDYAYLRIYRNYHSKPLEAGNAKGLKDGKSGLTIAGDGYIGENFYVGENMLLKLGDNDVPNQRTTLVPATSMHVRSGAEIILNNDTKLRLENSKLEFRERSKFSPYGTAAIEIGNSEVIFDAGSVIETEFLTNYNISVTGNSSFINSSFEMPNQSILSIESGAKFTVVSGSNLFLSGNSVLYVKEGAELVFEEGTDLALSGGSELFIENNATVFFKQGSRIEALKGSRIRGSFTLENNVVIEVRDNSDLGLQFTYLNFPNSTTLRLGNNAILKIENGSNVILGNGINLELSEGSEIVVMNKGNLTATGTTFSYTGEGNWLGINAMSGSSVSLDKVKVTNAETGVKGIGNYKFNVTNSVFTNCFNGIDVSGMASSSRYTITGNKLAGTSVGTGISVTSSQAATAFENNEVRGFNTGVRFVHSSPVFRRNIVENNASYGLRISGQSSIPHLIDDEPDVQNQLNNSIINNATTSISTKSLTGPGQIGISPYASVYMQSGRNNVYSGPADTTPSVPCIEIDQMVGPHANDIVIQAEGNYWGSYRVTDDFFSDHIHYTIDYSPWSLNPFSSGGSLPPQTPQRKLLGNAISLEEKGNYTAANKIYEMLLKRFRNSPEYFVTLTRLPGLYEKAGIDDSSLIAMFDNEIGSSETSNKKFFKSLKVSAHILSKRYDPAIDVAKEMKSEAEYEEEIVLAEINIAIANMLKEMESEGKGNSVSQTRDLRGLISKLYGDKDKNEPSDITEIGLPSQHELFQNYPNPFNPVTQIRFALKNAADVKLIVYNIAGQKVAELVNGSRQAGINTVDFDGSKLNSGIYYYTLEIEGKNMTRKMLLTK